jgi:sensor c-di-GMP phosphodiesterase-like protein
VIENAAQRQFQLHLGVPVGQGFLFARGLLPNEFARRLQPVAATTTDSIA